MLTSELGCVVKCLRIAKGKLEKSDRRARIGCRVEDYLAKLFLCCRFSAAVLAPVYLKLVERFE